MQASVSDFQWNRSGYAALMNSAGVQSIVKGMADTVCGVAKATGSDDYVVKGFQGKLAKGYVVRTANNRGYQNELENNGLQKGLGSIGG